MDGVYRGYIRTKNKKSIDRFKNVKGLKTLDDVRQYSEYAGVLADDVILIDVDDKESSDKLYRIIVDLDVQCIVYNTTRGKHFIFKNTDVEKCYTHVNLAVGIVSDIKVGCKNSYEILKFDGKEREVIRTSEQLDELPLFLYPVKTSVQFADMVEGDGRNNVYFTYILTLQSAGFEKDDIREIIRLSNKYVLNEPLATSELDVILRDESFQKATFTVNGTFRHNEFGDYIRKKYNIKRINGQLHVYRDGIYVAGDNEIFYCMIEELPTLPAAKRREVLEYLKCVIKYDTPIADASYIAFSNGIYDLESNKLLEFNPSIVMTNIIPWDYNENAYHELTDKTINKLACNDPQIRSLIEEMTGCSFYRRNEIGKAIIITGDHSNGKSTFLNMLRCLLGNENCSALDLKKLGDRFSTVMLFNKLANIGDDISNEYISDSSEFKKIITGDVIDAEQKGQPKFQFKPYAKCFFSANNVPRIGNGKDFNAIKRRLQLVPFNAFFSKNDEDYVPRIIDKLTETEAMEYMIQLGIQGLKRVLKNNGFTECDASQELIEEYEETTNPIVGFLKDYEDMIINHSTNEVYWHYSLYCENNKFKPVGQKKLTSMIIKALNVRSKQLTVNGKRVYCFVEDKET